MKTIKQTLLILLFTLVIVRFDCPDCKCYTHMRFKIENKNHPLRKMVQTIVSSLQPMRMDIPNINFGGCGVFAFEMKKMLDSVGIKSKILVIDDSKKFNRKKKYINDVLNNCADGFENTSVNHVILYLEELGISLDSDGIHSLKFDEHGNPTEWHGLHIAGEYSMVELEYAITKSAWNSLFKRERIPEMRYYIRLIKGKIRNEIADDRRLLTKLRIIRQFKILFNSPVYLIQKYLV